MTAGITRYARVGQVEVREVLPKTSVGKIDKKALRLSLAAWAVEPA